MIRVSVVMPCYNAERYLGESIQSILDQTLQDFELIVVDDGSTDGTRAVVETFDDSRLRYIYRDNGGPGAARNTGISAARHRREVGRRLALDIHLVGRHYRSSTAGIRGLRAIKAVLPPGGNAPDIRSNRVLPSTNRQALFRLTRGAANRLEGKTGNRCPCITS